MNRSGLYCIFLIVALFLSGCAALAPPPPKSLPESFLAHTWMPYSDSCHNLKFYKNGIMETRCKKKLTSYDSYKIIHQAGPEDFYLVSLLNWSIDSPTSIAASDFHYIYVHIWLEPSIVGPADTVLQRDIFMTRPTEEEWLTFTPEQHWQKIKKRMELYPDQVSMSTAYGPI